MNMSFFAYLPTAYPESACLAKRHICQRHTLNKMDPETASIYSGLRNLNEHKAICARCGNSMYPHTCAGAWMQMHHFIQKETQEALNTYEKNHGLQRVEENSTGGKKVLIHLRL